MRANTLNSNFASKFQEGTHQKSSNASWQKQALPRIGDHFSLNPKSSLSIHDKYNSLLANLVLLKIKKKIKKKRAFFLLKPKNQTWGGILDMHKKEIMVSIQKIKMLKKKKKRAKTYSTETSIFSKKKGNGTLDIDVNIQKRKRKKKKMSLTKTSHRYKKCQINTNTKKAWWIKEKRRSHKVRSNPWNAH